MSERKMTKAERLYVAGQVAPTLRAQSERASKRVVKVYDQETGEVVRHVTLADVQRGILETAKIELDVVDGKRPTHVACVLCGRLLRVEKGKVAPRVCRGGCDQQQTCAGWGETEGACEAVPPKHAFQRCHVARRHGRPWRCAACDRARRNADPDLRGRMIAAARLAMARPKDKARRAERMRALNSRPDIRARRAAAATRRASSPEYREAQSAKGFV